MNHGHHAETGEQEDQGVAQAQVIVDGAEQHDAEDDDEKESRARRDDEDAALRENDRQLFVAAEAEQPLPKRLRDRHQRSGVLWINSAMSSTRA